MQTNLSAKILKVLPIETGQGTKGDFKKQVILLDTTENEKFPKQIAVTLWGDNTSDDKYKVGSVVNCEIDIESREFNGKYFTDIKCWKINA